MEEIILIPLFIAALLLIPLYIGMIGWFIAELFGLGKFIEFDVDDNSSMVATGFWLQWQFWASVLVGAAHTYITSLISNNYGDLLALAYFISPFVIMLAKNKILELLKK